MTKRTVVGSGPARRPLPMGREAVERAIRSYKFWRVHDCDDATHKAFDCHNLPLNQRALTAYLEWLPDEIHEETVDQLRARLEAMP